MEGPGPGGPGEDASCGCGRAGPSTPKRRAGWPTPGARATPRSGSGRSCRTSSRCGSRRSAASAWRRSRPWPGAATGPDCRYPWIVSGPAARKGWPGPTPRRAVPDTSGPEKSQRAARRSGGSSARKTPRRCSSAWPSTRTPICSSTTSWSPFAPVPGREPVATAGVVTEVRARHEGATYGSDVFLIADGVLPAQVQEIAEVTTTRVDPEVYVPPWPGAFAYRATGEERAKALYFDQMERKVAAGLGRDGDPIYLNLEFLDGTRGGHVSISGISGVATKTSFALFLLYSIFTGGALKNALNAKALVFSVKGEDLLFLDHANRRLDEDLRAAYATLGLDGRAVRLGRVLRPADPGRPHGPPARRRPHQRGERVLVDARRVLLRRAAAVRLRGRGGRAQPVHDGHPPGRGPAAPGGRRHRPGRGGDARGPPPADLRRPDRVPLGAADGRGRPPRLGGPGHRHGHRQRLPAPAAVEPQAAALDRPRRPAVRRAVGW